MPDSSSVLVRAEQRRHACQRCWARKQKCDRVSPKCSNCNQADVECMPRTIRSSGDEDDSFPSTVIGEGYVQSLKRRISHLEELDRAKRPRSVAAAEVSPNEISSDQRNRPNRRMSLHDALTDFGHFALNTAPAATSPSQDSTTWSLSLWHLLRQTLEPGRKSDDGHATSSLARAPLRLHREVVLPIVHAYVHNVLPAHPFIEKEFLLEYAEQVVRSHDEGHTSCPPAADAHQFLLVYVVLATVYSANRRSPEDLLLAAQLRIQAAPMCTALNEAGTTVAGQCVAALALCFLYSNDLTTASRVSRMAISNAVAMGYHRLKISAPSSMSPEHRSDHSLFWTLYSLDRAISFATGQPNAISDADICTQASPTRGSCKILADARKVEPYYTNTMSSQVHGAARLLSTLSQNRNRPRMYFTHMYHSWKEAATLLLALQPSNEALKQLVLSLECRLLVCLYHVPAKSCEPSLAPLGLDSDETAEATDTCKQWLQGMERQHDLEIGWTCCLDAYEITSVGVLCLAVNNAALSRTNSRNSTVCSEVYVLAVSLLSYLSTTHPAAAQMRRALSALHKNDGRMRETCLRNMEETKLVPRRIRNMLRNFPLKD